MRKNFFQLPLQRQIQIGVVGVSLGVCSMIFIILLTSTLILVDLTYKDFSNLIYLKENQQLDQIGLYYDIKSSVISETTKYSIQWIRNFVKNNEIYQDFMANMNEIEVEKYLKNIDYPINYDDCNSNKLFNNCIFYKNYDDTLNLSQSKEFLNYLEILTISIPVIQKTFSYRFQDNDQNSIFNSLLIYSNKFKTVFIYFPEPRIKAAEYFDKNYTLQNFDYYLKYSSKKISVTVNNYKESISATSNVNELLMKNPEQIYLTLDENLKIPYYDKEEINSNRISTMSFNFKNLESIDDVADSNKIIDIIQGDWSTDLIDKIISESIKSYNGTKLIIADLNDSILTPTSCHYLLKFYEIQNDLKNYTNGEVPFTPKFIDDCIMYPPAKEKLVSLLGIKTNTTTYQSIKRKINIPLWNDRKNSEKYSDVRFKINKYSAPDFQTKVFINSFFTFVTRTTQYIFKNTKFLENSIHKLWNFFARIIILILFYNLMTWFLFMMIIIIIVWKVTKDITRPIDRLIEEVTKLGGGVTNNDEEKGSDQKREDEAITTYPKEYDEEITYPDDEDINEMFKICESLIKGGFSEYSNNTNITKREDEANLLLSYNNIAFVKTNDLIILEDFIEYHATNNKSIFSWKKDFPKVEGSKDLTTTSDTIVLKSFHNRDNSSSEKILNVLKHNKTISNEISLPLKKDTKSSPNKLYASKTTERKFWTYKKDRNYDSSQTQLHLLNEYSDLLQLNIDKNLEEHVKNIVADYDKKILETDKTNEKKKEVQSTGRTETLPNEIENKIDSDEIIPNKKGYLNSIFMKKTNNGSSLFLDVY
jgi:hypothetical protein